MLVTVSDVVSPSYFVATAAVELGYFKSEGVDAEFVFPPADRPRALREGRLHFVGTSAYSGPVAFPEWRGGKLLCALSQHSYWFLAVRADLHARRGDVSAVKGLRISATGQPGLLLKRLLVDAGIDLERDGVRIVPPPPSHDPTGNLARIGAQAIEEGLADAFWGNAMRAEYAVRRGIATVLVDVRRGDGPPSARQYTFPALLTSDTVIEEHPDAAAGAIRAIVRTQQALRADPSLATQVGNKLFPSEEAGLIADLIARDAPFYDATISEDAVDGMTQFARDAGLLSRSVAYDDVVATQFRHLWAP
ncbi:MAG TPA: ABC transporter substrate-binding protein [Chloroflexota bacterium]|nr:ABC transporter substrate-binding protein [Chloroflexota bacterium]